MAKKQRRFSVSVTISDYKGKVIDYALVKGIGYWHESYIQDWQNKDCELEDIASFDIEQVILHSTQKDITGAYRVCKQLSDSLADCIDKGTLAHMEYLFSDEGKETIDIEYTDATQSEANYAISMIAEKDGHHIIVNPVKAA